MDRGVIDTFVEYSFFTGRLAEKTHRDLRLSVHLEGQSRSGRDRYGLAEDRA